MTSDVDGQRRRGQRRPRRLAVSSRGFAKGACRHHVDVRTRRGNRYTRHIWLTIMIELDFGKAEVRCRGFLRGPYVMSSDARRQFEPARMYRRLRKPIHCYLRYSFKLYYINTYNYHIQFIFLCYIKYRGTSQLLVGGVQRGEAVEVEEGVRVKVFLYVCIIYIYIYIYTCVCVCMYICMYVRMYVCMYACMHA